MNEIQKIGVIIPTYRRASALIECIQSVKIATALKFDVIVVNDGGDIAVSDALKQNFAGCIELTSDHDLWWTKAVNLGLAYLLNNGYTAAILLNDDVTVNPSFVDSMASIHHRSPDAIIVSKVIDQNGVLWSLGGYVSWPFHGERHFLLPQSPSGSNHEITWSPGMGTLIPLVAVEKLGFLDERAMPQYLSDTDFGLRASKKGWKIILNQDCVVQNNTKSTGGVADITHFNFRDLYFIFFDLRSPDYLKARFTFIYRHAPFGLRTISFVIRVANIFAYFIKRFIK